MSQSVTFRERCVECLTDINLEPEDLELVRPLSVSAGEPPPANHYRYRCPRCLRATAVVIGTTVLRLLEASGIEATDEPTISDVDHVVIRFGSEEEPTQ